MQRLAIFIGVCLALGYSADADMLVLSDPDQSRLFGRLLSREDGQLIFLVRSSQGDKRRLFREDEVIRLVVNVDSERLAALTIADLEQYRDYAEELVTQRQDPVARELAIRLLLITAFWADGSEQAGLRNSALRNLQPLARSQREQRAFVALAQLYGVPLRFRPAEQLADKIRFADRKQDLLQLVSSIRQGDASKALPLLKESDLQAAWTALDQECSWQELIRMVAAESLNSLQLERLLRSEIALQTGQPVTELRLPGELPWSAQAIDRNPSAELLPDFQNVTEFDPRLAHFRQGNWIEPTERD